MKKTILKTVSALFMVALVASCSTDAENEVVVNDNAAGEEFSTARGNVWDGVIGEEGAPGVYEVTADENALLDDLEDVLSKEGIPTNLRDLQIVEKTASNDPNDRGFFLIGSDYQGTSIGVMLDKNASGEFYMSTGSKGLSSTSTSCRGCATGCNLSYLTVDGKKVPFCNENGCINDCEKSESNYL